MGLRFRVALSFPGEHRSFVSRVADHLADSLGREQVFYDRYYESELARPDLSTYLQGFYHDESELIAVFLCAEYEAKEWCGLEWRAILDLIKKRRTSAVMPLRFDMTEIPGLFSTDGYLWIGDRPPEEVAAKILERLNNSSTPTGAGLSSALLGDAKSENKNPRGQSAAQLAAPFLENRPHKLLQTAAFEIQEAMALCPQPNSILVAEVASILDGAVFALKEEISKYQAMRDELLKESVRLGKTNDPTTTFNIVLLTAFEKSEAEAVVVLERCRRVLRIMAESDCDEALAKILELLGSLNNGSGR